MDSEVPIHEDNPELGNNQENRLPRPPLASRLLMPPPLQATPPPPQPLPTAASTRCNRNRLKRLRRKRRQQRSKQLENPSGVYVQNGVYINATAGSTVNNVHWGSGVHVQNGVYIAAAAGSTVNVHWRNCFNSSSPTK